MSEIYLKYTGAGFMPGVPARDLTLDEAKQFNERELLASGLYVKVKPKPSENKLVTKEHENKE